MVAMEERIRRLFWLYMFVKHVVDIQAMILQGEWEKIMVLSMVYESMGMWREAYKGKNGCTDF